MNEHLITNTMKLTHIYLTMEKYGDGLIDQCLLDEFVETHKYILNSIERDGLSDDEYAALVIPIFDADKDITFMIDKMIVDIFMLTTEFEIHS